MAIRVIPNNPTFAGLLDLKANIPFACPDGEELCLQLLKPQWASEGGKGFPLVVFIQGSAWTKPNQFWELPQMVKLSLQGYVIASLTHRSCWNAPAPAFLQDVKTAIRFLRAKAAEYDIDKTRVAAFGTSSGGNTALLLGLTGDNPAYETEDWPGESTAVNVVVDCFGPPDVADLNRKLHGEPIPSPNLMLSLGGGNPDTYMDVLEEISPINLLKPASECEGSKNRPPFLILHGDKDKLVPFEDSVIFYNKLLEYGYEADLVRVTDAPHENSFWSQQLFDIIFDFIKAHL